MPIFRGRGGGCFRVFFPRLFDGGGLGAGAVVGATRRATGPRGSNLSATSTHQLTCSFLFYTIFRKRALKFARDAGVDSRGGRRGGNIASRGIGGAVNFVFAKGAILLGRERVNVLDIGD